MPSIWIADLAAYNAGHLVGEWVELDADTDAEDVYAKIKEILARGDELLRKVNEWSGPHEEFAIHDYDGFGPIKIGEYDPISEVLAHVERMGGEPDLYFAYVKHHGEHYADSFAEADVIDTGCSTMEEVAGEHVSEFILPEIHEAVRQTIETYFDYESFARDLDIEGNFVEYGGRIYEIVD
ncbi:ArdA-like antirestriction protein [Gordonia phage Bantam]|uniref:ArdA-like antirestriction protein n=1 Tax=Gordonia phage Bantam TaxID=1887641 RepID=A0A1B3AYP3_9CAUD|nr:anti-restriction protein [Gordonia phage Bantam]AOE43854.1 ArdA-like antirestriction protein [Gordonia phage Bantam]